MNEQVHFFEHAPTRTIGRTRGASLFQVTRRGRLVQEFELEGTASADRHGRVLLGHTGVVVNLGGTFPVEVEPTFRRLYEILHPDDGKVFIDSGRLVHRTSDGTTWHWWTPPPLDNWSLLACSIHVAPDETWVLSDGRVVQIGRTDRLLTQFVHDEGNLKYVTFDLPRERVLFATASGLLSVTFDGGVQGQWSSSVQLRSPPHLHGDDLLAAVEEDGDQHVLRFDPLTMEPRGRCKDLPKRRTRDESVLATLADGTLVWVPEKKPAIVARTQPPIEVKHRRAKWYDRQVGTTGALKDIARATSEERRSLARYLLTTLDDTQRFELLADVDPSAFDPYGDEVLDWPDERIAELHHLSPRFFWVAARGASNRAVDRIITRLWKADRKIRRQLGELLAGVESSYALRTMADTARELNWLPDICRARSLEILGSGPAIRRYSPERRPIIATAGEHLPGPLPNPPPHSGRQTGLRSGEGAERRLDHVHSHASVVSSTESEWDPDGSLPGTEAGLPAGVRGRVGEGTGEMFGGEPQERFLRESNRGKLHVLAVPSNLVLAESPFAFQHFFTDPADDGSELTDPYVFEATEEGALLFIDGGPTGATDLVTAQDQRYSITLGGTGTRIGTLGGRPPWDAEAQRTPSCPRCDELMFYFGCVRADALDSRARHYDLFGFQCERCGIGAQVAMGVP